MSQPKSERRDSHFQILSDAKKLRNKCVALALRDFGVKDRVRDPKFCVKTYQMNDEDSEAFLEIIEKYNMDEVLDEYPKWFIEILREKMIKDVFDIVEEIEISNVYPTTIRECNIRRDHQNIAIAKLFDLYQWIELAATTLPLDLNDFKDYFELIEKEVSGIKSLRKYDNRVRRRLQKKEKDSFIKALEALTTTDCDYTEALLDKAFDLMTTFGRFA